MKLNDFFAGHSVFTLAELDRFLAERGTTSRVNRNSLLSYHKKQGRILSVRRGLYVAVPPGSRPETCPFDPFLLAAKMTPDAVLAYHTALEFYGKAYSVFNRFYYLSARSSLPLQFRGHEFHCVSQPRNLVRKGKDDFGVNKTERSGVHVMVTGLERTLVDVLHRPDLSGWWEEVWRSLEMVEFYDIDKVVAYTSLLGNATTAAKVGFFLEQHRDLLMIGDAYLQRLEALRPSQPHYMERSRRESGTLVSRWNLVVPEKVLQRSWSEVL